MTLHHRLVAALAFATMMLCAAVPARAGQTYVLSSDVWTDIGACPAMAINNSRWPLYVLDSASQPSAGSIGGGLLDTQGWVQIPCSTHLWARAAHSGETPVVAVTNAIITQVGSAQKITTTATIASGQTVSGAIDLGTARLWALTTPATLAATAVTFLASADCSTYSALYDSTGTAVSWTVSTSRYIVNASPAQWLSVRCLKLSIASSEGADRTFQIEAVP